ncbi:MAG: molybdopterin-guanine dinucleotide biosynthesis protein B [Deltaproteobacteria bacterium]|nr:MAG: molybdopterin-guanine dinucleotide biosynthesis protein B [Deltaproteobacteria bacterium]
MPPIVSIVGKSKSGKTTLVEKLIPELKRRGYRIGTIKHAHHGFTLDQKGKDSARHRAAGADAVIVSSPHTLAMVRNQSEESIESLAIFLNDMDLVIVEGFKGMDQPKIEVCRSDNHKSPITPPPTQLIAFVSDMDVFVEVPRFGLEEIERIADMIETKFLQPG